jgi:hypothetical protein
MPLFKKIDYSALLVETLGAYHSVNTKGELSYMYKFCLCCLYVLQVPFSNYDLFRVRSRLIASCLWQIGQLQNVLNFLYDSTLNRIVVGQSVSVSVFVPNIDEGESSVFVPNIDEGESTVFVPNIDETINSSVLTILVPNSIFIDSVLMSQLVSDIEKIRLKGILYQISSL